MGRSRRGASRGGACDPTKRLKTAKGRKASSQRWLERQLRDPYVRAASKAGYRSRAAYKLIELDDRFRLLGPGKRVADLGAAPGGWTQVAVERVRAGKSRGGRVFAVDLVEFEPVVGAEFISLDVAEPDAPAKLARAFGWTIDVVLSDMAPAATGHAATDHLRTMALCEAALEVAKEVLRPGGAFVAKVLKGGTEHKLLAQMRRLFRSVRHAKPPASRPESAETYVVAAGFRGAKEPGEEAGRSA